MLKYLQPIIPIGLNKEFSKFFTDIPETSGLPYGLSIMEYLAVVLLLLPFIYLALVLLHKLGNNLVSFILAKDFTKQDNNNLEKLIDYFELDNETNFFNELMSYELESYDMTGLSNFSELPEFDKQVSDFKAKHQALFESSKFENSLESVQQDIITEYHKQLTIYFFQYLAKHNISFNLGEDFFADDEGYIYDDFKNDALTEKEEDIFVERLTYLEQINLTELYVNQTKFFELHFIEEPFTIKKLDFISTYLYGTIQTLPVYQSKEDFQKDLDQITEL